MSWWTTSPTSGRSFLKPVPDVKYEPHCPLCQMEKTTNWYHEEDRFVIMDCDTCDVPMGVWREHGLDLDLKDPEYVRMLDMLGEVADRVLGEGKWWLDPIMRSIPGHHHAHARPNWARWW